MEKRILTSSALALISVFVAACNYAVGTPITETTPSYPYGLRDVVRVDINSCTTQRVSGDSRVDTIAGTATHTFDIQNIDGDNCRFDMINQPGSGYSRWACRVPRLLGTIAVQEYDKGVTDLSGYRYGHTYSFDLGKYCTLAGCGPGVVIPTDCPREQ
jgi:hypothetical protein